MNPNRNPVGWFEIYVQDIDRAKTFTKTLKVTFEKLESPDIEMWAFPFNMDAPGAAGSLVKWRARTPQWRHHHLFLLRRLRRGTVARRSTVARW